MLSTSRYNPVDNKTHHKAKCLLQDNQSSWKQPRTSDHLRGICHWAHSDRVNQGVSRGNDTGFTEQRAYVQHTGGGSGQSREHMCMLYSRIMSRLQTVTHDGHQENGRKENEGQDATAHTESAERPASTEGCSPDRQAHNLAGEAWQGRHVERATGRGHGGFRGRKHWEPWGPMGGTPQGGGGAREGETRAGARTRDR
jgi:hypothetical protein